MSLMFTIHNVEVSTISMLNVRSGLEYVHNASRELPFTGLVHPVLCPRLLPVSFQTPV